MIDAAHLTRAEHAVLYASLTDYLRKMRATTERNPSGVVRNRALWHAYEAERLMAEIDGR